MKTIRVTAAVIRGTNEYGEPAIFATQRGYGSYKDKWEFPGGKIEPGETAREALAREIREELDSDVEVGELITTLEYDYPDFHLSMDCFWCRVIAGELKLREHEAARWLSARTLDEVDWLPADLSLIELLKEHLEAGSTITDDAISYIKDLFRSDSGGHDANHTMRVYRNALEIASTEPECDERIAALAALLHDADDHKLFNTENNANARAFLERYTAEQAAGSRGYALIPAEIERICAAINDVSFSQNKGRRPKTIEGCVVQDADRLDAMGALGIARTFAYGGAHGRGFDDSIRHFHEKLLRLKDLMNTERGRQMAQERHEFLEDFLRHYEQESGQKMEYFDVCDENGNPTGEVASRSAAHRDGIRHRTAHVWIIRKKDGRQQILMQKRSDDKDSFPGMYDTSSAGHVPAGSEPLSSALRELQEELGISAAKEQLIYAGSFANAYEQEFHGGMFRDNEVTQVYVYKDPVDIGELTLQESEVSEVRWFDLEEVWEEIHHCRDRFCVPTHGLVVLRKFLGIGRQ